MFQIVKGFKREPVAGMVFNTYPEAKKACDSLRKEMRDDNYSVDEVGFVEPVQAPIDPMWINKEQPAFDFKPEMYGSPRESGDSSRDPLDEGE